MQHISVDFLTSYSRSNLAYDVVYVTIDDFYVRLSVSRLTIMMNLRARPMIVISVQIIRKA